MPSVQFWPKDQNPLAYAFWGSVIAVPFWIAYWRQYPWAATPVVVADILFFVLYLRHSYFAWHVALVLSIGFTVYHLAVGHYPRLDIAIGLILVAYLLIVRRPYSGYVRQKI